jgi:hypothetical protein
MNMFATRFNDMNHIPSGHVDVDDYVGSSDDTPPDEESFIREHFKDR